MRQTRTTTASTSARFVDPFRFQMNSNHEAHIDALQQTRDDVRPGAVERLVVFPGDSHRVGPDAFLGWEAFDRLRVEALLEDEDDPSTHTVDVFVIPPSDYAWRLLLTPVYEGHYVFAPTAVAPVVDDTQVWTLQLLPAESVSVPAANLSIVGHPGRAPDCSGPTGVFTMNLGLVDDTIGHAVEDGSIEITRFDATAFEATLSGTAQRWDTTNPDPPPLVFPFGGAIVWPESGCSQLPDDPNLDALFGHYTSTDPTLCSGVWEGTLAFMDPATFDAFGDATADVTCDPGLCPANNRVGTCDFRQPGAQAAFAGTVQVYYVGTALTPQEIQQGCELQGGVYVGP